MPEETALTRMRSALGKKPLVQLLAWPLAVERKAALLFLENKEAEDEVSPRSKT